MNVRGVVLVCVLLSGILFSQPVWAGFLGNLPEEKILSIPTYDGSNQVVHPDILYFPQKFNERYFYLAFTPYPFSRDVYENPSILGSNDGVRFERLKKGLNPLVFAPYKDHNDDPELFYNERDRTFYYYYLETLRSQRQNLILLTSTNTLAWQKEKIISYDLKNGDEFILSPAVAEHEGLFYLFYVAQAGVERQIKYYTSDNLRVWDKTNGQIVFVYNWPADFWPWHLNIVSASSSFYLLVNNLWNKNEKQGLFIGKSYDLKSWYFKKEPLLTAGKKFHNSQQIYRSTGLVSGNDLAVWFSFQDRQGRWSLGLKKFQLGQLFSPWQELKERGKIYPLP